ncbi:MAG: hypothetical protein F6K48_02200 [Okeania sp. SIO3H1]|uniref:hypothetical protein n=1 Tax=Okeania sp. SIO1I7 TaxID=2607772 RepID=UPI0013C5CE30|nr:hypothetical protein [Okeania sp. SIO1I7]NEN87792.1 hypothetical protein [Okeania sp. SIO3H1]NET26948.1 hypothetical protein [Okeania sp. SIO1I7]
MSIKVWPFLVSRNPYLDYTTVVAPDFICEAKTENLLARVTTGDLTEPEKGFIRQIVDSKVGDFTIVYRILKATQKDLNFQEGDEILKDQFGREILLIEGVVIQGIKSQENVLISQKNMEEIHQKLIEGYTEFWEHRDPHPAIPSDKLFLSMDGLELEEIEKIKIDSKPPIPAPSKSPVRIYSLAFILMIIIATAIFIVPPILYKPTVYDCTTTEEKNIIFESKKDIGDVLKKLQKDNPNATIFLNGYLILESNKKLENLPKREELSEPVNYTINLYGDILKLKDHPLDLAIAQLRDQKVGNLSKPQKYFLNLRDTKLGNQEIGDTSKPKDYIENLKNAQLGNQEIGDTSKPKDYIENLKNAQLGNQEIGDTSKPKDYIENLRNAQLRDQELEEILKLQNYLLDLGVAQSDNQETVTIKAKIINRKNKKECQSNS